MPGLRLLDSYDIPDAVVAEPHSPAFSRFLWTWFGDPMELSRGELDLTFLTDLTQEELSLARELIRRNLQVKHTQLFQGVTVLHDVEAAPILRKMLDDERDLSWQLTIASALWKLTRDPIFVECLERAKSVKPSIFQYVHLLQVLWLGDARAVDFLIDLLDQKDRMARSGVLRLLNELESGKPMWISADKMPRQPADYCRMRGDPAFRAHMVAAIQKRNAESKNGR
jgi:hypothetical protein